MLARGSSRTGTSLLTKPQARASFGGEAGAGEEELVDARPGGGVALAVNLVAAAEAGEDADGGLGLAEDGALGGDAGVAAGGELEAAAEDATDEGGDGGLALTQLAEGGLPLLDELEGAVLVAEHGDEAGEVGAVAELAAVGAVGGEDDGVDVGVALEGLVGAVELGDEGEVQGAALEREQADAVHDAATDVDGVPAELGAGALLVQDLERGRPRRGG
jgi:hypothetical protein